MKKDWNDIGYSSWITEVTVRATGETIDSVQNGMMFTKDLYPFFF